MTVLRARDLARVCLAGRLRYRRLSSLPSRPDHCAWRGAVFCPGELVQVSPRLQRMAEPHTGTVLQDLFPWWFEMVCRAGQVVMRPRQWREVVTDARYKHG